MKRNKILTLVLCATIPSLLISWASVGSAIKHKNLETSVQMSNSIFIDELAGTKKSIYVKIRNTTDDPYPKSRHGMTLLY